MGGNVASNLAGGLAQRADYYWIDNSGNVFANQNSIISGFPYVVRYSSVSTGVSMDLFGGTNYSNGSTTGGTVTASIPDLTQKYGNYGPQSWKVDPATTATFYTGINYTNTPANAGPRTYGPSSTESDTFKVNGYPWKSVQLNSMVSQSMQQIGTAPTTDKLAGAITFWTWDMIIANMKQLVYAAQSSTPATYTGTVVNGLLTAINNLSCTTFLVGLTPMLPSTVTNTICAAQIANAELAAANAKVAAANAAKVAAEQAIIDAATAKAIAAAAATAKASGATPATSASSTSSTSTKTILGINLYVFVAIVVAILLASSSFSGALLVIKKRK